MASIVTTSQKLEIAGIGSIVVTDAVPVGDGTFVRAVRFFGATPDGTSDAPLLLEVRAIADTKAAITIATPASGF